MQRIQRHFGGGTFGVCKNQWIVSRQNSSQPIFSNSNECSISCRYQFSTIFTTKVAGYNHVIYGEELQDDEVLILTIPDLNGSVCRSLGMGFLLSTTFCLLVCKISDEYADSLLLSRYSFESWSTWNWLILCCVKETIHVMHLLLI